MSHPNSTDIFATMEATWPPASHQIVGQWTIRQGKGGGRRVSATTGPGKAGINGAEAAMSALHQPHLFMIRENDAALDRALSDRGYVADAPTTAYCCPVQRLAAQPVPPLAGFAIWPPLAIMKDIWRSGGIDAARLAVMDRVPAEKTAIFARMGDRAAGTAFVAIHHEIAMVHAIEVAPDLRRQGVGINIMQGAAKWAQDQGARYFSLLVTDANLGAIALYKKLGMSAVGHYHYRMRQK